MWIIAKDALTGMCFSDELSQHVNFNKVHIYMSFVVAGYENQDWFIPSPALQVDEADLKLSPDRIRETLNYFRKYFFIWRKLISFFYYLHGTETNGMRSLVCLVFVLFLVPCKKFRHVRSFKENSLSHGFISFDLIYKKKSLSYLITV